MYTQWWWRQTVQRELPMQTLTSTKSQSNLLISVILLLCSRILYCWSSYQPNCCSSIYLLIVALDYNVWARHLSLIIWIWTLLLQNRCAIQKMIHFCKQIKRFKNWYTSWLVVNEQNVVVVIVILFIDIQDHDFQYLSLVLIYGCNVNIPDFEMTVWFGVCLLCYSLFCFAKSILILTD